MWQRPLEGKGVALHGGACALHCDGTARTELLPATGSFCAGAIYKKGVDCIDQLMAAACGAQTHMATEEVKAGGLMCVF